jgi:hypothetical protein
MIDLFEQTGWTRFNLVEKKSVITWDTCLPDWLLEEYSSANFVAPPFTAVKVEHEIISYCTLGALNEVLDIENNLSDLSDLSAFDARDFHARDIWCCAFVTYLNDKFPATPGRVTTIAGWNDRVVESKEQLISTLRDFMAELKGRSHG